MPTTNDTLRRLGLLALSGLFLMVLVLSLTNSMQAAAAVKGKYLIYVGTYTDHGSKAIYAYRLNAKTG